MLLFHCSINVIGVLLSIFILRNEKKMTTEGYKLYLGYGDVLLLYHSVVIKDCRTIFQKISHPFTKNNNSSPCKLNLVLNNSAYDIQSCMEFEVEFVQGDIFFTKINTSVCGVERCIVQAVVGKCEFVQEKRDRGFDNFTKRSCISSGNISTFDTCKGVPGDSRTILTISLSVICTFVLCSAGNCILKRQGSTQTERKSHIQHNQSLHQNVTEVKADAEQLYLDVILTDSDSISTYKSLTDSQEELSMGYENMMIFTNKVTHSDETERGSVEEISMKYEDIIILADRNFHCDKTERGSLEVSSTEYDDMQAEPNTALHLPCEEEISYKT